MIKIGYSKYLRILISPSTYFSNSHINGLKEDLSELFFDSSDQKNRFFLTENGRTGFHLLLRSFNFEDGTQVAVQPFTCNSAVNPVLWSGLQPIYVDINKENLSMDPTLLERELKDPKNKIKAVLLQHTFGIPGNIEKIKDICGRYNLFLIEDCAHSIGSEHNGKKLGTFGDASIISFGLEKNLPTKVGGALLVNNNRLIGGVRNEYNLYKPVGILRTILWMLNPLIRIFSRKMGDFGKWIIGVLEEIGLFEVGFSKEELSGGMPSRYPKRISRPIARIAKEYLPSLTQILEKRRNDSSEYAKEIRTKNLDKNISKTSEKNIAYLKYPFYTKNLVEREDLQTHILSRGYYLSDWYENPIYPAGTDQKALYYEEGSCPVAEKACATIINLPTGDPFDIGIIEDIAEFYESRENK